MRAVSLVTLFGWTNSSTDIRVDLAAHHLQVGRFRAEAPEVVKSATTVFHTNSALP